MRKEEIKRVAGLLKERNAIDAELARIIQRPMTSGHPGEWIASQIFDIELEALANNQGSDGRFRTPGPLKDRTVNVKWYLKQEGLLDVSRSSALDYYLVLTGPRSAAGSSQSGVRPWCIQAVHLFDAQRLLTELNTRGVGVGTASSVITQQWTDAEIYPRSNNDLLRLTADQIALLELFAL